MSDWPKHGDYSDNPIFRAAQIMTDAAQILDVTKGEWGASWSAWDQGVRDRITDWLRCHYDGRFNNHRAMLSASPPPTPGTEGDSRRQETSAHENPTVRSVRRGPDGEPAVQLVPDQQGEARPKSDLGVQVLPSNVRDQDLPDGGRP